MMLYLQVNDIGNEQVGYLDIMHYISIVNVLNKTIYNATILKDYHIDSHNHGI